MNQADIIPPLFRIRQPICREEISDLAAAILSALAAEPIAARVSPGMRIAVTAGSRGIDRIPLALSTVVAWLRGRGARPFILGAMGSHGGATPAGRAAVLRELGITEETVGAPIETGGETVSLGEVEGIPVHCSALAAGADGIIAVNRIKPHTSYAGRYESGLAKMLAVGLGGERGAVAVHSQGARRISTLVPALAEVVLEKTPALFGLALIENGLDRLARVAAIPAEEILAREPELLLEAKKFRPRLPFDAAEVLVVDYLGKDISGTGMDTAVIGRLAISGEPEPERPRIKRIVALRLSPKSLGSAYGLGLADATTAAALRAMDPEITRANALASTFLERARVPLAFPSDRGAILAAIATCGQPDRAALRLARIRDTLHLDELLASAALFDTATLPIECVEGPLDWRFDSRGDLVDLESAGPIKALHGREDIHF